MIINKIKALGVLTFSVCLVTLPVLAKADLTIHNLTHYPSTVKIINPKTHKSKCSSTLPVYGVTQPRSDNPIPYWIMYGACLGNQHPCEAEVYMSDNCDVNGKAVAYASFDIDDKNGTITLNDYHVDGFEINSPAPFEINLLGGPPASANVK